MTYRLTNRSPLPARFLMPNRTAAPRASIAAYRIVTMASMALAVAGCRDTVAPEPRLAALETADRPARSVSAVAYESQLSTNPAIQQQPAISGNTVVWLDRRHDAEAKLNLNLTRFSRAVVVGMSGRE